MEQVTQDKYRIEMDAWIRQIKKEHNQLLDMVQGLHNSVKFLNDENTELKQEINSLKLIQIIALKHKCPEVKI